MVRRHRQMYEYLIFLDRDEFLHFVDTPPTGVNLAWEFHSRLADTTYTSLAFMTAVYRVRCLVESVHDLAEQSVHEGADSGVLVPHDVWYLCNPLNDRSLRWTWNEKMSIHCTSWFLIAPALAVMCCGR